MRPERLRSLAWTWGSAAGLLALATLTLLVVFVARHRDATPVTPSAAQAKFDRLRAQFAGQTALVDMQARSGRPSSTHPSPRALRTFHTVIFDRRGGDRLIEISLP